MDSSSKNTGQGLKKSFGKSGKVFTADEALQLHEQLLNELAKEQALREQLAKQLSKSLSKGGASNPSLAKSPSANPSNRAPRRKPGSSKPPRVEFPLPQVPPVGGLN